MKPQELNLAQPVTLHPVVIVSADDGRRTVYCCVSRSDAARFARSFNRAFSEHGWTASRFDPEQMVMLTLFKNWRYVTDNQHGVSYFAAR